MKRLSALRWFTALALLLGQWGMLVHAGEHPVGGVDDALCVVCVQGHNLQQLQVSHTAVIALDRSVLAPAAPTQAATAQARPERSTIRAPPHFVHN